MRAENEPNRNDDSESSSSSEQSAQDQDGYEVRRASPKNGDSFVGGLDILTVHRMIEADQLKRNREDRESA